MGGVIFPAFALLLRFYSRDARCQNNIAEKGRFIGRGHAGASWKRQDIGGLELATPLRVEACEGFIIGEIEGHLRLGHVDHAQALRDGALGQGFEVLHRVPRLVLDFYVWVHGVGSGLGAPGGRVIGFNNAPHQRMTHDVGGAKGGKADALHAIQNRDRFGQAGGDAIGQIDL